MVDDFSDPPELNLTPLIDVIFMLVIFFVMTMTFSKPVLEVVLPQAEAARSQHKAAEVQLAIRQDGTVWSGTQQVEDVGAFLDMAPEGLLNLFVDEKAPFEAFVRVVDVAKARRGSHFVISTRRKADAK